MRYMFMRFPGGKPKAYTMSYDDGVAQDVRFSDIITKYGLKCTFNLNTDMDRGLTAEQIRAYSLDRGHEIAVHGANHRACGLVRAIDGIKDVLKCRVQLEKTFGIIIRGMAYPDSGITRFINGADYENIKRYLTDLDIAYSRTLGGDNNSFMMPDDWHAWMPTAHHDNPKIMEYIDEFVNIDCGKLYGSQVWPRLFYQWGHSYEFDINDNWEHLEDICRAVSGHEDIWYATNSEIYEYTEAYNSLVYSADGNMIYNPTLFEIWFVREGAYDGKPCSIKPGETKCFE